MLIKDLRAGTTFYLSPSNDTTEAWVLKQEAAPPIVFWGHSPQQDPVWEAIAERWNEVWKFPHGREVYIKSSFGAIKTGTIFHLMNPNIEFIKTNDNLAVSDEKQLKIHEFNMEQEVWI